jgi:peptide/nickel transport system permease protein
MARQAGSSRLAGLKRIAKLYVKSRIGMVGLIIILFYLILAVFAPWLAPNPPLNHQVGSNYDIPSWATIFPQYSHVPVDSTPISVAGFGTQAALASWTLEGQSNATVVRGVVPPSGSGPGSLLVSAPAPENLTGKTDPFLSGSEIFFSMSRPFQFSGSPPSTFDAITDIKVTNMTGVSQVYINFIITNSEGNFSMASSASSTLAQIITYSTAQAGTWVNVDVPSGLLYNSGIPVYLNASNPSDLVFNVTGAYRFTIQILGHPVGGAAQPELTFYIGSATLHLNGGAYGVLGTDNVGNDVWSQMVWGSQISLEIGIFSGVGAVAIGALVGLVAGYLGGMWDEVLGRFTDFVLVLPFLPLLFIIVTIIAENAALSRTIYVWIIVVFVVISWPLIARIIRSQVLSIKERPYVEASRAVGGGTWHIITRHILPNVMGLVYSQVALNVSGFILLEAALDFLSAATHSLTTISWGIMLTNSLPDAVGNSAASYVWWWFLPPGVSIALLSLAFVLVGFALDSIFNPRLRAR